MKRAFILLFVSAALWFPGRASAVFYTVTGAADNTDATPHGGTGAQGSPYQMLSLRGAILAANSNIGPDTILLPAGTYTLTIPNTGGINEDAGLQDRKSVV